MVSLARRWWPPALQHRPWPPSPASASRLDPSCLLEEEKTPYYRPERFYPARLGQILSKRYQLATKLGYGSSSTVWLARDLCRWRWSKPRYVAVKINATAHHSQERAADAEVSILKRISKANPRHGGRDFVRMLVDSFELESPGGKHVCLVMDPLREPLWLYSRRWVGDMIPLDIVKAIVHMILRGLDYLHSECRVIHTDLKPDNIMVKLEDPTIVDRDARDEYEHPLPQKHVDGRTIYLSRNNYGKLLGAGLFQITDFDLSVVGDVPHHGCIQAEIYRAPKVVLDVGYSYAADIWSLGVMLWEIYEGRKLFSAVDPHEVGEYEDQTHLAYMTSLLGPPPGDLLATGRRTSLFFRPDGTLKNPDLAPADFSFENSIARTDGEEKRLFIQFAKKMIMWRPEERSTAKELLEDPWLYKDTVLVPPHK